METQQLGIDFYAKDSLNYFDDIEHLLKSSDNVPSYEAIYHELEELVGKNSLLVLPKEKSTPNAVKPPTNDAQAAPQSLPRYPQLFSVENGVLQPITSLLRASGVFKKDGEGHKLTESCKANNVFVSPAESHGRIIKKNDFYEHYVSASCKQEEPPEEMHKILPRKVLLHESAKGGSENKRIPSDSTIFTERNKYQDLKQWDALSKLADNILKLSKQDHIVIDRKYNEIVRTENGTNQKTIYRFLTPEAFFLTPKVKETRSGPPSLKAYSDISNSKCKLKRPKRKAELEEPGQKTEKAQKQTEKPKKDLTISEPLKELRTRSGRLVKLVKPTLTAPSEVPPVEKPKTAAQFMRNFIAELKVAERAGQPVPPPTTTYAPSIPTVAPNESSLPLATSSPIKRRIPPESICPTCNKIFLGRRLQRHFTQHPTHMKILQTPTVTSTNSPRLQSVTPPPLPYLSQLNEEMTLFRYLIQKLQKSSLNEDQRADLFLHEINDLVEQLQMRSSRLIRNTSGLHFVTARSARVLGIPEGQYALDMSAIQAPPPEPEPEPHCAPTASSVNTRSLDYTALSMDDTLTDEAAQKLNLSAGGKLLPPSEESLLRVVGDLVHEGMTKLNGSDLLMQPSNGDSDATLVPHIDHASDNAVEALSMKETNVPQPTPLLDLPVDFFQFNNN